VIGGDGDMLSIGGNHLIHALRRNVGIKIVMFNNQIYGLTKGQYSPTSEVGKITKSSPFGSLDQPFNPISVALGAEATFVARTHDMDRKSMMDVLRRAHEHEGAAFVEIYQNCNVFNDGAFEGITAKEARADMLIELKHGEPIRFGNDNERGVVLNAFGECEIVEVADVGEDALLVHDETRADPALAGDPSLDLVGHTMHRKPPLSAQACARERKLADIDDLPASNIMQRHVKPSGHRRHLNDARRIEPREQRIIQPRGISLPAKRRRLRAVDSDDEKSVAEIHIARHDRANRIAVSATDRKDRDSDLVT